MNKLGIWVIAIAAAFVIGVLSANPVVEAVGGWQSAFVGLDTRITDLENEPIIETTRFSSIIEVVLLSDRNYYFNHGQTIHVPDSIPIDPNLLSTMSFKDGTITKFQFWMDDPVDPPSFRVWNLEINLFVEGQSVARCFLVEGENACSIDLQAPLNEFDQINVVAHQTAPGSGHAMPTKKTMHAMIIIES